MYPTEHSVGHSSAQFAPLNLPQIMLCFPEHSVFRVLLRCGLCGDVQNFAYCDTFCGDSYFDVAARRLLDQITASYAVYVN
jgi:hypothetical protein